MFPIHFIALSTLNFLFSYTKKTFLVPTCISYPVGTPFSCTIYILPSQSGTPVSLFLCRKAPTAVCPSKYQSRRTKLVFLTMLSTERHVWPEKFLGDRQIRPCRLMMPTLRLALIVHLDPQLEPNVILRLPTTIILHNGNSIILVLFINCSNKASSTRRMMITAVIFKHIRGS